MGKKKTGEPVVRSFLGEPRLAGTGAHRHRRGKTYGHHHHRGEIGAHLRVWKHIESKELAALTCYGRLSREASSDSRRGNLRTKRHGAASMASNAGKSELRVQFWPRGLEPGVGARPLREAFDALRDTLAQRFEERAGGLLKDPWAARDDYIDVVLNRF